MFDMSDPAQRAFLADKLGPEGYNKAMDEYLRRQTVVNVNGHDLRMVQTRFGTLYHVGTTPKAFSTLPEAIAYAQETPP